MSQRENRLAGETSPYLLQHAHNPVDWYPWGPEALERARSENKPILLSIGYAACHWCHVMERESFENDEIAAKMNEHFVSIKVDREERPDLDEIYMAATVAMSGSGGWPMTVFLTPDTHEPFFAGTYFPPRDMYGRPGFPTLLERIAQLWKTERDGLCTQARELAEHLHEQARASAPGAVGESTIDAAVAQLKRQFDARWGGFGGAPKFPPSMALELLLRHHRRTGEQESLGMLRGTLDGMANGGMRDHLGGGFARYSTDERWLVPHFEKMLYDNALLARVYAWAWQCTDETRYREVATETLDYVLREMTSPDGAFYSATDADSEGEEGKFFVWTPDEVEGVLPLDQARPFCLYYDVSAAGNWEGKSILHTPRSLDETAGELGMTSEALATLLGKAKQKMYAARLERVPPLLDDKILTAWNALMIAALAEGGRIFDEARYVQAAARAADFILTTLRRPDGGLYRTTRAGKTHLDGYLEDYAYSADALVDVYEATGDSRSLEGARDLAERMVSDFRDEEGGGFFTTANDHEKLLVRMREGQDGPIPSGNASAARALLRLGWHLGRPQWRELAMSALGAHGQLMERAARAFCASLCVVDMLLEGPVECVLAGRDAKLRAAVGRAFLPNRVVVHLDASDNAPAALIAGKGLIDGKPALYVCRDFVCKKPVTDPEQAAAVLADDRLAALAARQRRVGRRLEGRATPEGTARYAARLRERWGESAYRELGTTGLVASRLGFGGYRVDDQTPTFSEALDKALLNGVNLIDTSTNYTDGGSERLVGRELGRLMSRGKLARDEVIVVSKVGYVQGKNLELAQSTPFAEMVEYTEGCWHCIHPDWLADQLDRSLDRLGLETVDVYLLHNPEYFLSHAAHKGGVHEAQRVELYARFERAFAFFEEQVKAGRIGCYGVSSNSVAQAIDADPEATELARMLEAARRAGGEGHHFRVLQLPLNLLEPSAALAPIIEGATVLSFAKQNGIAVLVNRPLNAIMGGTMLRLADVEAPRASASLADALDKLRALERRFADEIAGNVSLGGRVDSRELFRWGDELGGLEGRLDNLEQYEQVARGQILPHVGQALALVERALPGALRARWSPWRTEYIRALETTLSSLRAQVAQHAAKRVDVVRAALDPLVPASRLKESLSKKALWALLGTEGVDVVLLGMRRPSYVDDALPVLSWAPPRDPAALYAAMSPQRASTRET